eukprot:scaffold60200_cov67-Phaeocystis_antarctica.AAC.3
MACRLGPGTRARPKPTRGGIVRRGRILEHLARAIVRRRGRRAFSGLLRALSVYSARTLYFRGTSRCAIYFRGQPLSQGSAVQNTYKVT